MSTLPLLRCYFGTCCPCQLMGPTRQQQQQRGKRWLLFMNTHTHTHTGAYNFFPFARNEDTDINVHTYIQLYVRKYTHTGTYTRTRRYILLLAMRLQQMHIQYSHWQLGAQYTNNGSTTTQASIKLNNKLNNLILIIFKNTHTKNVVSSSALEIFTNTNDGKHTRP